MIAVNLDIADDVGGCPGVTGIKNAAHLFVVFDEAIGLIDEKRRVGFLDVAKQRTGGNVARQLRARRQIEQDDECICLAATLGRRDEHEERRYVASI